MSARKSQIDFRERLKLLTNKNINDNINKFEFLHRLKDDSDKNIKLYEDNIKFNNISQFFGNHNKNKKYLKNRRLNEIFDKDKNYNSNNFAKKYKELFDETFFTNNTKDIYNMKRNDYSLSNLNPNLILYINKIKEINNKNKKSNSYKNLINDYKIKKQNRDDIKNKINNTINNIYSTSNGQNRSSSYNKINKLKNELLYKKINDKIRFNNINKSTHGSRIIHNKKGNIFRKNHQILLLSDINNSNNNFNSVNYYDSFLNGIDTKLNKNNFDDLFSLRKKIINKKLDSFRSNFEY